MVNTVTKKNAKDAQKTFSSAEYFYRQAEALKKILSFDDTEHEEKLLIDSNPEISEKETDS